MEEDQDTIHARCHRCLLPGVVRPMCGNCVSTLTTRADRLAQENDRLREQLHRAGLGPPAQVYATPSHTTVTATATATCPTPAPTPIITVVEK